MKIPDLFKQYLTEKMLKGTFKVPSQLPIPTKITRLALEQLCRVFPEPEGISCRRLKLAGLHAEEIKPVDTEPTQMVLHFHGGAFFVGSLNSHRTFMMHIAKTSGAQVVHVDYPLAPEHPFPEAIDDLVEVYQTLLEQGVQPKDIILSGDSCGANLALCLALRIKVQKLPMPSGLILLSPLLDLTLSGDSIRTNRLHDALLAEQALKTGIAHYLQDLIPTDDPRVSPLFDDLSGLPPTLVQIGSKEILLSDATRFKALAEDAGVKVYFTIYPGMWHNFQMFNTWFPDAQRALDDMAKYIQHIDKD